MTLSAHEYRELCDEFSLLHEGALDEDRQRRLAARVNTEPPVFELYLRYMRIVSGLQWNLCPDREAPLAAAAVEGDCFATSARAARESDNGGAAARQTRQWPPFKQLLGRSVASLGVPAVFSVLFAAITITSLLLTAAQIRLDAARAPEPAAPVAKPPVVAARLVGLWNCEWIKRPASAGVVLQERFELRSGLVKVRMHGDAEVLLEGPVVFALESPHAVRLEQGKLTAIVPAKARGFTVATPTAQVIDLGTEFGVHVDEQHRTHVEVFSGKAEVRTPAEVPNGLATLVLSAGEIAATTAKGLQRPPSAAPRIRFVRRSPAAPRQATIANGSFELPALPSDTSWKNELLNWEIDGGDYGVSYFGREFMGGTPDGLQVCFLNQGALRQTLDERLQPQTHYELSLSIGRRRPELRTDYTVELWAGATLLVSDMNSVEPPPLQFAPLKLIVAVGDAHPALGEPLSIVLRSNSSLAAKTQNILDKVRLRITPRTSDTPEPVAEPPAAIVEP